MPNFSSQAKDYIQTLIRNHKALDIINFLISKPSCDDQGLIIINKITYIANQIVQLQPNSIARFRNEEYSTKINHQYQNRFETLNRLELFIQLLCVMQINNKHINEAEQIKIDLPELNISTPENHKKPQVRLTPYQTPFTIQQDPHQQQTNKYSHQPNTSPIQPPVSIKQQENKQNLKQYYEDQQENLPFHNNQFNYIGNVSSD